MKKTLIIISIFLIGFFLFNPVVLAVDDDEEPNGDANAIIGNNSIGSNPGCKGGILTEDGYEIVQGVLGWFRILAPATLVLMTSVDFFQAVVGKYSADGKENALAKAKDNAVKRFIAVILLIFVPTMVKVILGLVKSDITIPAECVMIFRKFLR